MSAMSEPTVDVRKNLRIALQHVLICGPDAFVQAAIEQADDAVAELVAERDMLYRANINYSSQVANLIRRAGLAEQRLVELVESASNAEKIIRNCVAAGQIGKGYQQDADDLRASLARFGSQK